MTESRSALLIATSRYTDTGLAKLLAPAQDVAGLARVMKHPKIGAYKVRELLNKPSHLVAQAIEAFFADRERDDLLVLYFSSHGIKDEDGRLYFATIDTERRLLRSTSIAASFVNEVMLASRSRRQVLLLDCCYSGAFARGMVAKADTRIGTKARFHGSGRVVLTASDEIQYSFEGDDVAGEGVRSVFTRSLVRGLETGEADLGGDGYISPDELYEYVHKQVAAETPQQTPEKWAFDVQGDIVVARNQNVRPTVGVDLSRWVSVRDQGALWINPAVAMVTAMETSLAIRGLKECLSAQHIAEKAKEHDGIPETEGTFLTTVAYVAEQFATPTERNRDYYTARTYRLGAYEDIPHHLALKRPILAGTRAFNSWFSSDADFAGRITMPSQSDPLVGHVAIVIVAFDHRDSSIRFASSWGKKWGDKGFGTMSEEVARAVLLIDQMWAIEVPRQEQSPVRGNSDAIHE